MVARSVYGQRGNGRLRQPPPGATVGGECAARRYHALLKPGNAKEASSDTRTPLLTMAEAQALVFTCSANAFHASATKASSGPSGSLLSRTATARPAVAT